MNGWMDKNGWTDGRIKMDGRMDKNGWMDG